MITSSNPQTERRRRLLTVLQYNCQQMSEREQRRLLREMQTAQFLNRLNPRWGCAYLRFELALARA